MPEAREEDEFEQVSGPVNQPKPRNHMNPEEFRIGEDSCSGEDPFDSNSQERARRGQPAQESFSGLESDSGSPEQTEPSAAKAFSNQGDFFAPGGGASAINRLPSQTKNGKAARKHHTT
jgi:hypothetical protein